MPAIPRQQLHDEMQLDHNDKAAGTDQQSEECQKPEGIRHTLLGNLFQGKVHNTSPAFAV